MPKKPTRWKSVRDDVVRWERVGQTIEGVYQEVEERNFSERTAKLYTLMGDGDQAIRFWGSTVLDQHMARVPRGTWVQIIFKGEAGQGNRRYKDFDVNVGEDTKLTGGRDEDDIPF